MFIEPLLYISKHKQPFSLLILKTHVCGSRDHINIEHAHSVYSLPKQDLIHWGRVKSVIRPPRYPQATTAGCYTILLWLKNIDLNFTKKVYFWKSMMWVWLNYFVYVFLLKDTLWSTEYQEHTDVKSQKNEHLFGVSLADDRTRSVLGCWLASKYWRSGVPTRDSFSRRISKSCNLSRVEAW